MPSFTAIVAYAVAEDGGREVVGIDVVAGESLKSSQHFLFTEPTRALAEKRLREVVAGFPEPHWRKIATTTPVEHLGGTPSLGPAGVVSERLR